MILVMSVNPGYWWQKFITSQLKKIESIRNIIEKENLNIDIEVDGGINAVIGKQCIDAWANVLVAGSYVFKWGPEKYAENIQSLR
jgi:ribulose-phosphate 3-epimerase